MESIAIAERLRETFRRRFGVEPLLVRAPGRVNLIGEHTDYNEGFVIPAAIDRFTVVAVAPRSDNRFIAESCQLPEKLDVAMDDVAMDAEHARTKTWTDYCVGVFRELRPSLRSLKGAGLLVDSTVPIGAGLSSSAALEVATGFGLLAAAKHDLPLEALAKACQRAENDYVGARCGIMDQFIACMGRAGHALVLDCRSLEYRYVPIPVDLVVVICNSMVKHSIAAGEYNARREECEEGVRRLRKIIPHIASLRDVSAEELESAKGALSPVIYRRCRHVVTENARVRQAEQALLRGDFDTLGRLMHDSHESLKSDYEVSCRELDLLVTIAHAQPGVAGSRMTGGGFGGCTVNLVRREMADAFRREVADAYRSRTGKSPEIYQAEAAAGVERIA